MNLATMDYFVALAEERSFTRAAQRLNVTQQTLSAHVAQVERELGVRLVNRKVPLTLTYAGDVFLGYARRFQAGRRAMEHQFADISGNEQGLLGVGIASTRGHMLMPSAIASFRSRKPGVDVLIDEGENDEILAALREGRVDMAVATVPASATGLEVKLLRREQISLVVSRDLLVSRYGDHADQVVRSVATSGSLAPLEDCPFLLLRKHDEPGDLSRALIERSGINAHVAVQSKNSETLVELASRGVGACFVERSVLLATLDMRSVARLHVIDLGPDACIDIHVTWRRSDHVWSVVKEFADLLAVLFGSGSAQ